MTLFLKVTRWKHNTFHHIENFRTVIVYLLKSDSSILFTYEGLNMTQNVYFFLVDLIVDNKVYWILCIIFDRPTTK